MEDIYMCIAGLVNLLTKGTIVYLIMIFIEEAKLCHMFPDSSLQTLSLQIRVTKYILTKFLTSLPVTN